MQQITAFLPGIGAFSAKTYAAWPVWRDSTTQAVKFQPTPKRQAVRLYHKARRFERQTRQPGHQDGALGRNGLAVLHALLFDFLHYATGRLEPAYARIADRACISARSVARGLVRLRSAGVLHWLRRCREDRDEEGRFRLRQESNAYAVLPSTQWRGFIEPEPSPLESWQLGAVPPLPGLVEQAAAAGSHQRGDNVTSSRAALAVLESDPGDGLAAALARLGRAVIGTKP